MLKGCLAYFEERIRRVMGENAPFFTRLADLKTCMESHVSMLAVESDTLTHSGASSRNLLTGAEDLTVFNRTAVISVTLGEYKLETLEPLFERFMVSLDQGFLYEGHYIALEPGEAEWVDGKDSLIKAQIAVQLPFTCRGGIYRPKTFATINTITIKGEDSYGGKNHSD